MLFILVFPVLLGIFHSTIVDALRYSVSILLKSYGFTAINCDAARAWETYFNNSSVTHFCDFTILLLLFVTFTAIMYKLYLTQPSTWRIISLNTRHIG